MTHFFRTVPRSQSKASVSEFHQEKFNCSSQPIKNECLGISFKYFLSFPHVFLEANQNRVSRNFIKVFFFKNFPHVSSQPIKSQCLRISSKYFSIFRTFSRSQSKPNVSKFHQSIFFKFSSRLIAANQTPVSQNFIEVFFNFSAHFFAANQR